MLKMSGSSKVFMDTLSSIFMLFLFIQTSGQKRIYIYVPDAMTQSEAKQYCRDHYTDLATFRNWDDIDAVPAHYCNNVFCWIGLQRNTYSSDVWNWSDGDKSDFRHWNSGEPNNKDGNENCVAMEMSFWTDFECDFKHSFLCYEDEFILVQENKTWQEALEYCRNLPSYNVLNINFKWIDLMNQLIQDAQTQEAWIGLRFLAGKWLWLNGTLLSNQLDVCPAAGNNCGTVAKTGEVKFCNCSEKRMFFCSRN
ncbi:hypothetical protein Q5P01_006123 [Channa striata]|uniref:C-type lectin domain-containing protein n=1 Tax=Channa striata TaxID=64152 RepID=A0AA88N7F4_CHASR|nr:hypothetical protein Q5P01_006123 [Channa striata]